MLVEETHCSKEIEKLDSAEITDAGSVADVKGSDLASYLRRRKRTTRYQLPLFQIAAHPHFPYPV